MPKNEFTIKDLGGGLKGVDFSAWGGVENFLRETSTGAGGTAKPQLLRRVNPWLAKANDMTALAIASLPFDILDDAGEIFDTSSAWKDRLGGIPSPAQLFYKLSSSLCLGKAYVIPTVSDRAIVDLHYCAPHTVVPLITVNGLQVFSRTSDWGKSGTYMPAKVYGEDMVVKYSGKGDEKGWKTFETKENENIKAKPTKYQSGEYLDIDTGEKSTVNAGNYTGEMMYFWLTDSDVEMGPAKSYPASVALLSTELLTAMDSTLQVISERGFVPPTLLAVKGMVDETEAARTEAWYNRFLRRWNETVAKLINAETMDIKTLGSGMEDLKTIYSEIKKQAIEDIAASYGIPAAIYMSDMAFATEVNPMIKVWYSTSVFIKIYQCIQDTMNAQLFSKFGLRMQFNPNELDAFQEDEAHRSAAYREYISTDMRPSIAAEMLGLDLPEGVEFSALDEFYESRLAGNIAKPVNPIGDPSAIPAETNPIDTLPLEPTPPMKRVVTLKAEEIQDLNLWRQTAVRFQEKSKPLPVDWECKHLPETIAAPIRGRLASAKTVDEVNAAFDIGVTIDNTDALMALADAINKAVAR